MVVNVLTQICSIHWFFSSFGVTSELLEFGAPKSAQPPAPPQKKYFEPKKVPGGGNSNIFYFHPDPWWNDPIWPAYRSNGLIQPPTRKRTTIKKN